MSLMLAADVVELFAASSTSDEHGWALPETSELLWTGLGNLQLGPGASDPRASDLGGHGPFDPAASEAGVLFLPADVTPADGMVAVVRDQMWVLSQVRRVIDPSGVDGALTCWQAAVEEIS